MSEYRTNKGQTINMDELRQKNEKTIAVGNMNVNAKGDLLGKGGQIKKTAKERTKPYYENNPKAVKQVGLKSLSTEDLDDEIETVVEEDASLGKSKKAPVKKATTKSKKSTTKKATISKDREEELEDGSIIIKDEVDGEEKD